MLELCWLSYALSYIYLIRPWDFMPFVGLEFLFCSHTGWPWNIFNIMAPGLHLQSITIYLTLPPLLLCHKPFKLYSPSSISSSPSGCGSCWFREDGSPAPGGRRGLEGRRARSWVEISLVPVAGGPVCLLFYNWVSWCRFSASPIYFKIAPLLGFCCTEKMAGSLRLLLRLSSRRALVSV